MYRGKAVLYEFVKRVAKPSMKVCVAATACIFLLGGCNKGEVVSESNSENNLPVTSIPDVHNPSENSTYYPIPEKIKTTEEIKAEGRDVTAEDINNGWNYLCYLMVLNDYGEDVGPSAEFVCIETDRTMISTEEVIDIPFYFKDYNDNYPVRITMNKAFYKNVFALPDLYYFPKEFSSLLDLLGAEKILLTEEDKKDNAVLRRSPYLIGQEVYQPIKITKESFSQITEQETLEAVLDLICGFVREYEEEKELWKFFENLLVPGENISCSLRQMWNTESEGAKANYVLTIENNTKKDISGWERTLTLTEDVSVRVEFMNCSGGKMNNLITILGGEYSRNIPAGSSINNVELMVTILE